MLSTIFIENIKTIAPSGWLSPSGVFTESAWGHHEETAEQIMDDNNWHNEWFRAEDGFIARTLMRDWLCEKKGYILLDDPEFSNNLYITYNPMRITRKQKDIIFGILCDLEVPDNVLVQWF